MEILRNLLDRDLPYVGFGKHDYDLKTKRWFNFSALIGIGMGLIAVVAFLNWRYNELPIVPVATNALSQFILQPFSFHMINLFIFAFIGAISSILIFHAKSIVEEAVYAFKCMRYRKGR